MKITNLIINAIKQAVLEIGGQNALSRITGVKQQNISRYISGSVNVINDATWEKLYPYLKPHLPKALLGDTPLRVTESVSREIIRFSGRVEKLIETEDSEQGCSVTIHTAAERDVVIPMTSAEFKVWKQLPDETRIKIMMETVGEFDKRFVRAIVETGVMSLEDARGVVTDDMKKYLEIKNE